MRDGIHRPRIYGFPERLDQACKDSGMSKSEIARRGGFDRKNLSSYCWHLSAINIARFCSVVGVSADWLLGLKGE